ncbi:McrB family protein [Flavobacterium sp. N2820]|uniref:McrB family protein n=1 Tax=Flavobacterium sp. N2820 TaxID=2986834 RepID=UPI00222594AF|nr:AAA family ATPase [Flavobacterium sp. N2820]
MAKILKYREYEEEVFHWLMAKHKANPEFTFSLRQNGSKGAELDYFIGTSKSNYFGTTFWTLPVSFPGSSGDCIDLIIKVSNSGFSYYVEFTHTKYPHDDQNKLALQFIQSIAKDLETQVGVKFISGDEHKMYTIKTKPIQNIYANLKAMLLDVEKQLDSILDIVDIKLVDFKKNHPSFIMHRITLDEFNSMLERKDKRFLKYEDINSDMNFEEETKTKVIDEPLKTMNYKASLNQILYGPPGTGKTYNTVLEAAKIVTGNETINYDEALKIFNENLNNQIEFITFHQNYSYEDFIQGLRPDTENGKELSFEKKDGVFKRIADRALKNLEAANNPASAKKDFDVVFQELIQPLNDGDVEELEIKMKKSSFYITEVGEKSIEFRKNIGDSNHTLSINTLRKMYDKGENDIILGGLQPYYNPILELLLAKGKSQVATVSRKNYVIIIDEINRANISRVFGELITLIEEDKRSHGKIPMRVTLPSGDSFIVPSNLYIIGTMNTADKSISLLDIALRRRFEFVPMYPKTNIEGVNSPTVLETINAEIIKRKGHDFTIGHAYFMGDNYSLEKTINSKVIPLLLEYFMNDEKEVATILKAADIEVTGWPMQMKTA